MTTTFFHSEISSWVNAAEPLNLYVSDDSSAFDDPVTVTRGSSPLSHSHLLQRSTVPKIWHPKFGDEPIATSPQHRAVTLDPWTESVDVANSAQATSQMMAQGALVCAEQAGNDLGLFGYSFGSATHLYSAMNNQRQYERIAVLLIDLKARADRLCGAAGVTPLEMSSFRLSEASFLPHPQYLVGDARGERGSLSKTALKILMSRIVALEAAMLAHTRFGANTYIFDSGVAALPDGTCGVFKWMGGNLIFAVEGQKGLSPHAVFANVATPPVVFDCFPPREGGLLYWQGTPYKFLKNSAGEIATVIDRQNQMYEVFWQDDRMHLEPLHQLLKLRHIYRDVHSNAWMYDGTTFHWALHLLQMAPPTALDAFLQADFYTDGHGFPRNVPRGQAWSVRLENRKEAMIFEKTVYLKNRDGFYYPDSSSAKYALVVGPNGTQQLHFLGSYQQAQWIEEDGVRYAVFPEINQAYYFMSGDLRQDAKALERDTVAGCPVSVVATRNTVWGKPPQGPGSCFVMPSSEISFGCSASDTDFAMATKDLARAHYILLPSGRLVLKSDMAPFVFIEAGDNPDVHFTVSIVPAKSQNTFFNEGMEWEILQDVLLPQSQLCLARPKNGIGDENPWRLFERVNHSYQLAANGFYRWTKKENTTFGKDALHAPNDVYHIYVKNGWVWDLERLSGDIDVLAKAGSGTTADPDHYIGFFKKRGDVHLASAEQIKDFLDASRIEVPEGYKTSEGRFSDIFYQEPQIDAVHFKGIVEMTSSYTFKTGEGSELLGTKSKMQVYELVEDGFTTASGKRTFTYYIPDLQDPVTIAAQKAGFYIPKKEDIEAFHQRMNQVLPRADAVIPKSIIFFPAQGQSLSPTQYSLIYGWYNASDDTVGFYQMHKGGREVWLSDVTKTTLVHEVAGHGRERGADHVRKLTLMAMILDGMAVGYNKTWRETFSTIEEFMHWVPALRHRFPYGFSVNYTLLTAADREYLGAGMLIAVGDR